MGKVIAKNKHAKVVQNKNGTTSTYTSYNCNGKTKWHKSGGVSTARARKKK